MTRGTRRVLLGTLAGCGIVLLSVVFAGASEPRVPVDPTPPEDPFDPGFPIDRTPPENPTLSPIEQLGKSLLFDANLSKPTGQSCASCHGPGAGFTGPKSEVNQATAVYPGAVSTRYGNRKPPAVAYGSATPNLFFDSDAGVWVGGMFWDGRATGWTLGDPLAEQAMGPFLNPAEMNMPSRESVCRAVRRATYAGLFQQVWGARSLDCAKGAAATYEKIGRSVAAYERSAEVNPFSSKYDLWSRGQLALTAQERRGFTLFQTKGKCAACHVEGLFTDFTYDNVGAPRNPDNPWYTMEALNPGGWGWVDQGLGGFLKAAGYAPSVYEPEMGKVKVPSVRNVDLRPHDGFVKVYGHNGYFKSLEEIVHFYNTRDLLPTCVPGSGLVERTDCWPAPEVAANINVTELGNLGLSADEEAAIVAFLKTLSDGYKP